MLYVDYAKERYDAAIREIERLKQSEFPYEHIRDSLMELEKVFRQQRASLDKLSAKSTPAIAKNQCSQTLFDLFRYTPYLGFVLRSTNVRNAFEIYAPILRIAQRLLGSDTKLLLSSEWDYSPYVYLPTADLSKFVLIGVPAYESSNPLLVALAGHELGHNVWKQQSLGPKLDARLRSEVLNTLKTPSVWCEYQLLFPNWTQSDLETNMFAQQTWLPAHVFAERQAEEVFCDAMGLRLFDEAYLHAFAYLLSPCLPGERSATYPAIHSRVSYLLSAAATMGIAAPPGFADLFDVEMQPSDPVVKLLVSIADTSVAAVVPIVTKDAIGFADAKGIPKKCEANVATIREDFQRVIPAEGTSTVTDIVNAGWACFHDTTLWDDVIQIPQVERGRVLYDLVLKSFEVAEYTERINSP